jgi:hypothetical protein
MDNFPRCYPSDAFYLLWKHGNGKTSEIARHLSYRYIVTNKRICEIVQEIIYPNPTPKGVFDPLNRYRFNDLLIDSRSDKMVSRNDLSDKDIELILDVLFKSHRALDQNQLIKRWKSFESNHRVELNGDVEAG